MNYGFALFKLGQLKRFRVAAGYPNCTADEFYILNYVGFTGVTKGMHTFIESYLKTLSRTEKLMLGLYD